MQDETKLKMRGQGVYLGQIIAVLGIVAVGVWGATQWTASALGYQVRLGLPWLDVFGRPIYAPWRLFEWWFFYDAYAPSVDFIHWANSVRISNKYGGSALYQGNG